MTRNVFEQAKRRSAIQIPIKNNCNQSHLK
jgi:hypothetical protein